MSDKASIIKEAQRYLEKGQIDKAIAEWEKLIDEYPDGNTYNTIGDLYLKKGDKKNAIDSFHKAASFFWRNGFSPKALALYKKILNIDPANADALFSLGKLNEEKGLTADAIKYYLTTADSLLKEGKKEKLLDVYNKILAISSDDISLRNEVAEIYAKEGLDSEAAKGYLYIARLYEEKGEIEESTGYYQKAIETQPLNKEAILGINYLYEKAGKLEQAIEQMKEATILFPQDADIYLRCAEIYIKGERFDEARECLIKVIETEPANIEVKRLLGEIYIKEGDREKAWIEYLPVLDKMILDKKYDDAIKLLESFKDIDPLETGKRLVSLYRQLGEEVKAANELISLGNLLTTMGMQKDADYYYKEALSITPDDDSLRAKVAEFEKGEKTVDEELVEVDIFLRYSLYDEARELLEKLKVREPENIDIHIKLKSLYLETGDKELAVTECLILAELYNRAGNIEEREKVLKEAYEINPEDPRLLEKIAMQPSEEVIAPFLEAEAPAKDTIREELVERIERPSEEFVIPGAEAPEVQKAQEPALDSGVLDMFNKFKEKIKKELKEEDYETHYDLGIAYKEMGLIDDAIREFQISLKDQKKFVQSSSMLGTCYTEKGLYALAVDVLSDAIKKMEGRGESYWVMKYDLAEAYEKNGNLKEAFDLYNEVYGWNSKFRAVSDKINQIKVMITKEVEQEKPKGRKDRVSYI